MPEIAMPRLSDSMEEGTIVRWLKGTGDVVARGEELVEIETDKADVTHEADAEGVLEILAAEGETLPIGAPIARIGGGGPAAAAAANGAQAAPAVIASAPPAAGRAGRVKASPVARRLAAELGVEIEAVAGSGPGGRVVKADVEAQAASAPKPDRPNAPAVADAGGAEGQVEVREPSRLQQTVARRMSESKATVPDFVVSAEVEMGAAMELRAGLKQLAGEQPAPSLNDMVVRATALALRNHPRVNSAYRDGRFEFYEQVNVGIAVAAEDALVVPVVKHADRLALSEIAGQTRALGASVRAGTITPPELSGGTFTVSNLGMFGVTNFTAIVNPGQAAILAVGAVREAPVVRDGEVRAGQIMGLSLNCDHRILYGADAAAFIARVRELLEAPLALVS